MRKDGKYAFISYSSKNQQMADSVRLLFQELGIPCWMAPYDIPAGSKYAFVINDALENCACLVLLLTNASQESQFVEREIERAITYGKPIVPMQLEQLQLNSGFKFYIGNSQIIAVPEIRADAPEFQKVLSGIRQFVGVPEPEKKTQKHPAIVERALQVAAIAKRWKLERVTSAAKDGALLRICGKDCASVCCDLLVTTVSRSQGYAFQNQKAHEMYLRELEEKKTAIEASLRSGEQLRREGSVVSPLEVIFHDWQEDGILGCDLLLRYEPLTSLRELLTGGETFSEDQIVKIGMDISRALTAFAKLGMVPPEVSLESVCLGRYGSYKLMQTVFTVRETNAADGVFSLGTVLTRLAEQGKKLHDPKGIHRNGDISRGLRKILNKACAADPAARYESAEEFGEALNNMDTQDHRTPSILQRDMLECGAASLAMIFGYWGKPMTLDQLCAETNVSPDGCNAGDIVRAAKRFGMDCRGYRREPEQLLQMPMPCILHWDFNHFLVLEEIEDGIAYLNDPASGHKEITMEELDKHFTGVVLTFRPTEEW